MRVRQSRAKFRHDSVADLAWHILRFHTETRVKQLQDAARTRRRLRESARQLTFEDRLLAMLMRADEKRKQATACDAPCKPDTSMHASAALTSRTVSLGCCHSQSSAAPLRASVGHASAWP